MALSRCARWLAGGLALLGAAAGSAAGATLADGQSAYDAGRYDDARAIWVEGARGGERQAALGLGLLYDLGRGVTPDPAKALHWYTVAADLGLVQAELNVAVMEDAGRAGPRDPSAAATWYARAAAHGDHRSEYDMGQLYAVGDGVPRNPAVAAAWFTLAAAGGLGAAADRLAAPKSPTGAGVVSAVVPVAPPEAATVRRDDRDTSVELVWTVPPEPAAARFYVEVVALAESGARPAFAGYAPASAALVRLPGPGRYAWRVYVVSPASRAYLPSAWQRFSVAPPPPLTSAPGPLARAAAD